MSGTQLPTVMTAAGLQAQPPATLNANLIAAVTATNPGYTANLPGSLIDDIAGTDTGALVIMDQARQDLVNSVTPLGANPFILYQLGAIAGVPQGRDTNTSVYVFFDGTPGFPIPAGFIVGDGTNQYVVQDGGILPSAGYTVTLYCLAINSGSFSVPALTVNQIITSVPSGVMVYCNNIFAGIPAAAAQTVSDYRGQVVQAGLVAATGTPAFLKTLLGNIPGVQPRLVAVRSVSGGYEVICGGGDPYSIAYAIYSSGCLPSLIVGSATTARNISININDYPDTYGYTFVNPPQQTVNVSLVWNTSSPNFVSNAAVAQIGGVAIVNYVNSIAVGQPINLFELQNAFQEGVASILATPLLTRMVFTVDINGTPVSPTSGTGIIAGDPESYMLASAATVSVTQG